MLKAKEKYIGNYNLIGTFLILVVFAFVVIMLSINTKIDNFKIIEKDIKNKFLEDKKNDIKFKINNINLLIENLNQSNYNDIQHNKKFIKNFITSINQHKNNPIMIHKINKELPYYNELMENGEYYKYNHNFDENEQKNVFNIE